MFTLKHPILIAIRFSLTVLSVMYVANLYASETVTGRFELIDHHGELVTDASYSGKFRLVFFGFTHCPVICPTTMIEITRVMNALGDRASRVQPLFITIDPGNDTVDVVASYVRHFHPSVIGLTGSRQQIADAARSFNVTFGGTDDDAEIYHSSYLYLMKEDGSFLDVFGYGAKAETITKALDRHLSTSVAPVHIIDPWASEPAGANASVVAGFMCIRNDGLTAVRVVGASSDAADNVMIHSIVHERGIVRMKTISGLDVAPESTVCLDPESQHFMLIGIDETLRAGADVPLELRMESGEILQTVLPQRALANSD